MSMRFATMALALGLLSLPAFSAQSRKYPSPEFNHKPAYFDRASNALVELERSPYKALVKNKVFTQEKGFVLEGAKSPVRFHAAKELEFVIKVLPGTDPTSVVDLCAFTFEGEKRIFITAKATAVSAAATVAKIPFQVKKIADGVYVLSVSNLQAGEYFLGASDFMFAFGIDG